MDIAISLLEKQVCTRFENLQIVGAEIAEVHPYLASHKHWLNRALNESSFVLGWRQQLASIWISWLRLPDIQLIWTLQLHQREFLTIIIVNSGQDCNWFVLIIYIVLMWALCLVEREINFEFVTSVTSSTSVCRVRTGSVNCGLLGWKPSDGNLNACVILPRRFVSLNFHSTFAKPPSTLILIPRTWTSSMICWLATLRSFCWRKALTFNRLCHTSNRILFNITFRKYRNYNLAMSAIF